MIANERKSASDLSARDRCDSGFQCDGARCDVANTQVWHRGPSGCPQSSFRGRTTTRRHGGHRRHPRWRREYIGLGLFLRPHDSGLAATKASCQLRCGSLHQSSSERWNLYLNFEEPGRDKEPKTRHRLWHFFFQLLISPPLCPQRFISTMVARSDCDRQIAFDVCCR